MTGVAIAAVLLMRLHLAATRAFDPDEFAHLHWAWLSLRGYLPYRDFFFYIPPGFAWFLSFILRITGDSVNFLIASRLSMFAVYGLTAAIIYRLSRGSLPATLLFLAFPVTLDKSIDIRPDMVMLLFYFGSVLAKNSFLSGVLYGASFIMFPKVLFGLPALLFIKPPNVKWLAGATFIGAVFFGYVWVNRLIPLALDSILRDSFAVTAGKHTFSPILALRPIPLIYLAKGGPSLPWAFNTAIWILAAFGLALAVKKNRRMGVFWLLFCAGSIAFIILFPSPYIQYFLPISIAASVLAGYALKKSITIIKVITVIIITSSFFLQYRERVAPGAENLEQLQVIRDVLSVTRPDEPVYDMVGSYVFRPDGYFICCHPFGEFAKKLTRPPPTLRESLVATRTKFLVMDRVGFVFWQTPEPDLSFLRSNYLPTTYNKIYSLGQDFRCAGGACIPVAINGQQVSNRSTNTFTIIVPETYTVTIVPESETATINDQKVENGQTVALNPGANSYRASPAVTAIRIQLSR